MVPCRWGLQFKNGEVQNSTALVAYKATIFHDGGQTARHLLEQNFIWHLLQKPSSWSEQTRKLAKFGLSWLLLHPFFAPILTNSRCKYCAHLLSIFFFQKS